LRNHLYETTLRRSSSFFHKHRRAPSCQRLSTMSIGAKRGQLRYRRFPAAVFHFSIWIGCFHPLWGHLSWALAVFVPVWLLRRARSAERCAAHPFGTGQLRRSRTSCTRQSAQPHREGLQHGVVEILRFKKAAGRLLSANMRSVRIQSISSPLMDTSGMSRLRCCCWSGETKSAHRMTVATSSLSISAFHSLRPVRNSHRLQQLPAGFGASRRFSSSSTPRTM